MRYPIFERARAHARCLERFEDIQERFAQFARRIEAFDHPEVDSTVLCMMARMVFHAGLQRKDTPMILVKHVYRGNRVCLSRHPAISVIGRLHALGSHLEE